VDEVKTYNIIGRAGICALLALAWLGGPACGQAFSHVLSFQGRLCATDGKPLPDGPYAVKLTMYDAQTGGNALWTETQGVTQVGGVFVAYLGSVTAFPGDLFTGGDRWLGIQVGQDPEMATRFPLTPSPWAIYAADSSHAAQADRALEADNSDTVDGFHASQQPAPNRLLSLDHSSKWPLSAMPVHDHWGETWTGTGVGLTIRSTGGIRSPDSVGLLIEGTFRGIVGAADSPEGAGVYGSNKSGAGVYGISLYGNGVEGESHDANHSGVQGTNKMGGMGVNGVSDTGTGVHGESQSGGMGVQGVSHGPGGIGVEGRNDDPGGIGVHAVSKDGIALKVDGKSEFNCNATFNCPVTMGKLTVEKLTVGEVDPVIVEWFRVDATQSFEPGDVLVIDPVGDSCRPCDTAMDTRVCGVVWDPALNELGELRCVVLGARALGRPVLIKVDAGYGPIERGDLLTTSPTPGRAMKAVAPVPGSIIGKALDPLPEGKGFVRALVLLD
jgi:hypothetical protein